MELIDSHRSFNGSQNRYRHASPSLDCEMTFSVYLPDTSEPPPVLVWLSGLTCTDENFVTKAGAQQYASEHGIAIVAPDTSPRGEGVPDDPDGSYDFGLGAGFYLNATQDPWASNYRMYDYIVDELPALLGNHLPIDLSRTSISGHSMGGHGALTIALTNPGKYRSVSAFSPICSPTRCPWGQKALSGYLGNNPDDWARHDATLLIETGAQHLPTLIDQGDADDFLEEQLSTQIMEETCDKHGYAAAIRMQPGYDHSYFFIASFIGEHVAFHADHLT